MFPSNNNDPMVYIDHSFLDKHFSTDYTKPVPDDLPLSFYHFPSPYYNQCELELDEYHDVFGNQQDDDDDQFLHQKTLTSTDNSVLINMPDCRNITTEHHLHQHQQQVLPRKRPASKTDRHSKINTKKGLRDRRMRLSLDVARAFFDLQDRLEYDKPSRTVEWLLTKAKTEINKLPGKNDSFGFEVSRSPSSIHEAAIEGSFSNGKTSKTEKKESVRQRKTSFRPLTRDLREKARERAKARTEKIMWSRRLLCNETTNNYLNKFNQDQNKNNPFLLADNVDGSIFNCLQTAHEHQLTGGSVLWETMGGLQQ